MFQDHWDSAEDKGFKRYKWTIYDVMAKCEEGLGCATPKDPSALEFCMNRCPLTREIDDVAPDGKVRGRKKIGCQGQARTSTGFITHKQAVLAYRANRGTRVYEIEYEGDRPDWGSTVYSVEDVNASTVRADQHHLEPGTEMAVGIDWGLVGQTYVIPGGFTKDSLLWVPEAKSFSGQGSGEIMAYLHELHRRYGDFTVYADISHPFENLEVEDEGFPIARVAFQKWKEFGIKNLVRYFTNRKIKISMDLDALLVQLKGLKRDKAGHVIKKEDHGPDALMCMALHFWYTDIYGGELYPEESMDRPSSKPVMIF
jgi:hypothetical protein